ncbi:zinc finger, CCHC-type containing protein [Tanacetum coccineum]
MDWVKISTCCDWDEKCAINAAGLDYVATWNSSMLLSDDLKEVRLDGLASGGVDGVPSVRPRFDGGIVAIVEGEAPGGLGLRGGLLGLRGRWQYYVFSTGSTKKLDKFEGHNFRRWQKKMHFLLTMLKMVYVLTTPMPELLEDATLEAIRIRAKWENDDYIYKGHILNDVDSTIRWKSNKELLRILGQYTQHGLKMDESISVSRVIDKLPPSWKDFKHTLKHGKDYLSLVQLGSHLRIEESLRAQDSDKGKGKEVAGPSIKMTEEGKNKNKQNKVKKRDFKEHGSGSGSNKKRFSYYNNGMFMLNLNKVPDDSDSVYMSSSTVV